jgi:GTPase SAR1 family protein
MSKLKCSLISESSVRKVNIPDNNVVAVTIWDLPGRDDVDLRKSYYRDVDAAVGREGFVHVP